MKERIASYISDESPFCKRCLRKPCQSESMGCREWKSYFVKNWNKNISTYDPGDRVATVFRYEHPDLIREGIVFDPSR